MHFLEYLKNPLYFSIVLYSISIIFILYTKPKFFFDEDGQMKQTGCGSSNKTIFSFPMYVVGSSIVIYFMVTYLKQ